MGWVLVFAFGIAVGVLINKFLTRSDGVAKVLSVSQDERAAVESNDAEKAFALTLRDAVNSLTVGVVVAGADGTVIFRNTLALGLTGAVHSDVLVDEAVEVGRQAVKLAVKGKTDLMVTIDREEGEEYKKMMKKA